MGAHSLLTPAAAAERLGLSVAELIELIEAGRGPACVKIRRTGRFNMARFIGRDVDEWAEALARTCDDCKAEPGQGCHPGCSSHQK